VTGRVLLQKLFTQMQDEKWISISTWPKGVDVWLEKERVTFLISVSKVSESAKYA
jgi:hypothetical protein